MALLVLGACASAHPCLLSERRNHRTRLSKLGSAPKLDATVLTEPRSDAERVEFTSDGLSLFGYVMKPAGDGPFPAVLYGHSAFNLRDFDMDNAKELSRNGFVVFIPAWRAENGNPGVYELWYGELDDAVAALSYLRSLPIVDPERVYAAGHSAGGTLALLLAEIDSGLRGVATSGAPLSVVGASWPVPFDVHDSQEACLRSPSQHVQELTAPVALFYGDHGEQAMLRVAARMAASAPGKITVTAVANADHGTAMGLAIPQIVVFFQQQGAVERDRACTSAAATLVTCGLGPEWVAACRSNPVYERCLAAAGDDCTAVATCGWESWSGSACGGAEVETGTTGCVETSSCFGTCGADVACQCGCATEMAPAAAVGVTIMGECWAQHCASAATQDAADCFQKNCSTSYQQVCVGH